uniref:Uncharacterized protein n=1 Tax=Timema tahoe TaxID=61484 RepID=A0A7R9NXH2_9NEOP|nr:unnamed protein product [Timema tahoe]
MTMTTTTAAAAAKDSTLVGDFKDTINYEAQRFQASNVEMKSPWDGFLPIKEQIKDESDTSYSVDDTVKTEIKLYDSSLGIMDSNIDHFTLVEKSEIKLEQDHSTLSRDIVIHMVDQGEVSVKLKIVPSIVKQEDIVMHMEGEGYVKLIIVLRRLNQEDIVLNMEEEGNVKLLIVWPSEKSFPTWTKIAKALESLPSSFTAFISAWDSYV